MQRSWVSIGVGALVVLAGFVAGRAQGGELPRDFAQQYAPAVEKLRDFYTHVTVSGTLKREIPSAKKSLEQKFVFRAAGIQIRLDLNTVANRGMGAKVGGKDMFLASRAGSLTTITNPGSQFFDDARELSYGGTRSRIESTCPLIYAYTFDSHRTLYDFLLQSDVTGVQVKKIQREGESLVKISYRETTGRQDRQTNGSSYFVLSPAEGWAVREYARTAGDGASVITYRGTLSYDGTQDGVPLVRRIENVQEQGPGRKISVREVIEVSDYTAGDPSIQYFTAFDF